MCRLLQESLSTELLTSSDNLKAIGDEVLGDYQKLARLVKTIGTVMHSKVLLRIRTYSVQRAEMDEIG